MIKEHTIPKGLRHPDIVLNPRTTNITQIDTLWQDTVLTTLREAQKYKLGYRTRAQAGQIQEKLLT